MKQELKLTGQSGRLDHVLTKSLRGYSRTQIQKMIKEGRVTVDHEIRKANFVLVGDETISWFDSDDMKDEPLHIEAQEMALAIVYEDEDVLVINKPAGLVVHPSKGHQDHTLVNGLLYYAGDHLSQGSEAFRPGLVHRLDKDTSGLLVVAKHNTSHQFLSQQLEDHQLGRTYLALVHGQVGPQAGKIEVPLKRDQHNRLRWTPHQDGKYALTDFNVKERFEHATLLELQLHTGRTHQIRVHLEYIGHPIIGDPVYRRGIERSIYSALKLGQFLHAANLHFIHPSSKELVKFEAPLPSAFQDFLVQLRE